jgi:hypothetical protein
VASTRTDCVWIDGAGERVIQNIRTASGASSIVAELEAVSQAKVVTSWEGTESAFTVVPGTGTYITVRQTAVLYFADVVGRVAKLYLPAPDSSIFLSDGQTVDPTTIPSLITACIGSLQTGAGTLVAAFVGGSLFPTDFHLIATV